MRTVLDLFPRALPLFVLVFTAACAASTTANTATTEAGAAVTPAAGTITLRVINSHSSGQSVRLFLQPQAGMQRPLGSVSSAATLNLPFTGDRGRYRFVAELPNGQLVESPYFNAQLAGVYEWDIALGSVNRKDR